MMISKLGIQIWRPRSSRVLSRFSFEFDQQFTVPMEPKLEEDEHNFAYFYQKYKFHENSAHKIEVARAKRIQLILNALQSRK